MSAVHVLGDVGSMIVYAAVLWHGWRTLDRMENGPYTLLSIGGVITLAAVIGLIVS